MSLHIDTNTITRVLLVDGWHDVAWGPGQQEGWYRSSFDLDSYEFCEGPPPYRAELDDLGEGEDRWNERAHTRAQTIVGGGTVEGVPSTGFTFMTPTGSALAGPLTAILAVERGVPQIVRSLQADPQESAAS
jgi:hypothetical protein